MNKHIGYTFAAMFAAFALITAFSAMSMMGNTEWWFGWAPGNRVLYVLLCASTSLGAGIATYLTSKGDPQK